MRGGAEKIGPVQDSDIGRYVTLVPLRPSGENYDGMEIRHRYDMTREYAIPKTPFFRVYVEDKIGDSFFVTKRAHQVSETDDGDVIEGAESIELKVNEWEKVIGSGTRRRRKRKRTKKQ
jgi:hypothetical protein